MHKRAVRGGACLARLIHAAILMVAVAAASEAKAAETPSETVRQFYSPTVIWEADPAVRDRFTGAAKALLDKDDIVSKDHTELGCLGFALAIDAQDLDQDEINRTLKLTESLHGDSATVVATFKLFPGQSDNDREMTWSLQRFDGDWKVADIRSETGNWRLSELNCDAE